MHNDISKMFKFVRKKKAVPKTTKAPVKTPKVEKPVEEVKVEKPADKPKVADKKEPVKKDPVKKVQAEDKEQKKD